MDREQFKDQIERGVVLCRQDQWEQGLAVMQDIPEIHSIVDYYPAEFYALLGYGLAVHQGKLEDGLALCRRAVGLDGEQPDHYFCLATVHMLHGNRRGAFRAMQLGLNLDPTHKDLLEFQSKLGKRSKPVIPLLARDNPINVYLGRRRARRSTPQNEKTTAKGS